MKVCNESVYSLVEWLVQVVLVCLMVAIVSASTSQDITHHQDIPVLDTARLDDLGWTDAHSVAYYGSPLRLPGARFVVIVIPRGQRRRFLEDAPEDFLCQRNDFGQTALHLAVRQDALEIVELYIDRKLHCLNLGNLDGDTPLHYAVVWGRKAAFKLLIRGGADPLVRNNQGHSCLDDAKKHGYDEISALLQSRWKDTSEKSDQSASCHRVALCSLL